MPYKGYNMEDAVILNKASVERGMFRSVFFRTYVTAEKKYWGIESDQIGVPDEGVKNYRSKVEYRIWMLTESRLQKQMLKEEQLLLEKFLH